MSSARAESLIFSRPAQPGALTSTLVINQLFEITQRLFDTYLARCEAGEYQFRWQLQAEPIETMPQLPPDHDDTMFFSVSFDPDQEIVKLEVLFRKTRGTPAGEAGPAGG
ncbi:MAG: hypothetical protein FJW37_15265 [Acidobacteria bacterium]|nr:hypothetical protein [Acidobacteriota bacterium]